MSDILGFCKVMLTYDITSDFVLKYRTTVLSQHVCVLPPRFGLENITCDMTLCRLAGSHPIYTILQPDVSRRSKEEV